MSTINIQDAIVNVVPDTKTQTLTAQLSLMRILQQMLKDIGTVERIVITSPHINIYINVAKEKINVDSRIESAIDSVSVKLILKQSEIEKLFNYDVPGLRFVGFKQSGDDLLLVYEYRGEIGEVPRTGVSKGGSSNSQW